MPSDRLMHFSFSKAANLQITFICLETRLYLSLHTNERRNFTRESHPPSWYHLIPGGTFCIHNFYIAVIDTLTLQEKDPLPGRSSVDFDLSFSATQRVGLGRKVLHESRVAFSPNPSV